MTYDSERRNNIINMNTVAVIVSTAAIAIAGYFANSVSALSNKVESVSATAAADHQYISDIDARTTRIESKLDTVIANKYP